MPTKRPKAGQADPETRRKKLREMLDTPSKATGVKSMKDAVDAGVEQGTESAMLPNGQKRRVGGPKPPKRSIVKRFGEKGQTEEELDL